MTEHIKITNDAGILTLVLDRPAKKNALTDAMYGALADALVNSETDPKIRVVLLRAEGDMFSAGNDVGEFAAVATGGPALHHVGRFLAALATATKPIVAAVQGRAVGIGTTMLLHADYVVLADDAQLTTPFVGLALVPEAASSFLLPARIGYARAFAMFALSEPVAAANALAWGLANRVVPRAELVAAATHVAASLARQPIGALIATKRLMRPAEAIARQLEVEGREFLERLRSPEAAEAFRAFAERRAPDFAKFV
jgi:enoyl-CoA hydratase/carnithine racemase